LALKPNPTITSIPWDFQADSHKALDENFPVYRDTIDSFLSNISFFYVQRMDTKRNVSKLSNFRSHSALERHGVTC
jgi:hypothetical protein